MTIQDDLPPGWTVGFEFAQVLRWVDDELPLLRRAAANPGRMVRLEEKWVPFPDRDEAEWSNLAQIFRTGFSMSQTTQAMQRYGGKSTFALHRKEMLSKHLESIELSLRDGEPRQERIFRVDDDGYMYPLELQTMGGARFYLRRDVEPDDQLQLLILRDLRYMDLTDMGFDGQKGEWLSEISLKVTPKP